MKYRVGDLPAMLRTAPGRSLLRDGVSFRLWPLMALAARFHRRTSARRTRLIAVTGSYGKSTTTRALCAALVVPAHRSLLVNAWSRIALAVLRIRRGQRHAVIEVGIAATGQMAGYARVLSPDVVVVTCIGSEHRRSLQTLATTRHEKSLLVEALPPSGIAVLNGDDPHVMWMRDRTSARVITFGFGEGCDIRASDLRLDWPHGTRFNVHAGGETHEFAVRLLGRRMAYAALAAIAVARAEGVALAAIAARLANLAPTPGRLEPVALPGGITILRDDFKSSLETIEEALDVLAALPANRKIVVLGDIAEPPERQRPTYRELGRRVAGIAGHLVAVGNVRGDSLKGARQSGMPETALHDGGQTPRSVIAVLQPLLQSGDVVLIKGRSTQMLDRVRLILAGRSVRCDIPRCSVRTLSCATCPMLERGWQGRRVID